MVEEAVSHEVILERVESCRDLVSENRAEIRNLRQAMAGLTAVSSLATDAIPRHEKAIDNLWGFVREKEESATPLDQHVRLVQAVERIMDRLTGLEQARNVDLGKELGSKQAYETLKSRVSIMMKALGVLTAGGIGVGTSIKALSVMVEWVL